MTIRLYYGDSYLIEFTALVLDRREVNGRRAVVLDQTAFYPTSGGQPYDTGMLGESRVVGVEENEGGEILHLLDGPSPSGQVTGRIDWERRFDHMQQHTGQHILSQAFIRVAEAATVSFHLGKETSTIDVELNQPVEQTMADVEDLASGLVFDDHPVTVLSVQRDDLRTIGVRKESSREGEIRVIDIDGFDRSPCGGTHVRRTGEIGMVSILGYERYKGGTRVEFVCGWRALRSLRKEHDLLRELGRVYSAHPSDLRRLTEKLLQERTAFSRENSRLQDQIFDLEAQNLIKDADKNQRTTLVVARFPGRGLESTKILAQKVALRSRAIAILAAVHETAQLVVARNPDAAGDCGVAIRETAARLGGKGGGKPEIAQAGGIAVDALNSWFEELEAYFLRANP